MSLKLSAQICDNSITATIPYLSGYASGSYTIYPRSGGIATLSNLQHPIIIVEGFDYSQDYVCQDIYNMMNVSVSGVRLASTLRSRGYDLIVLNFDNGGDYIQRNAFLLVELIKQINQYKALPNEKNVVVGYSMGGLVSRYALTYMEQNNMNHATRLFISYDSPQQGANIAMGVQSLLMGIRSSLGVFSLLVPELQDRYFELTCPAAKQMLIYHDNGINGNPGDVVKLPEHINFFNELRNLNSCNGYPKLSRNVAITLGSCTGKLQQDVYNTDMTPGGYAFSFSWTYKKDPWFALAQSGFATALPSKYFPNCPSDYPSNIYLSYLGGVVNDFMALHADGQQPLDVVPGSNVNVYEQINDQLSRTVDIGNFSSSLYFKSPTMIPTVSALDLATNNYFYNVNADPNILSLTPFETIFHGFSDNASHLAPARDYNEIQFVLNQISDLSSPACYPLSTSRTLTDRTVNSGENVIENNVGNITAQNYKILSGGKASFEATTSITLNAGFSAEAGSEFSANIVCLPKQCVFTYSASTLKSATIQSNNLKSSSQNYDDNVIAEYDSKTVLSNLESIENELKEISVYPNPSQSGLFYFSTLEPDKIQEMSIFNSFGTKLKSYNQFKSVINLQDEPDGLYILQIRTSKGMKTKKIIKNKNY